MILAVLGTRTFDNYELLKRTLDTYEDVYEIISGGASGADSLAIDYAKEKKINWSVFGAGWAEHGKSAGYKRNDRIWKYVDKGIIFWDGKSKGTSHSIQLSKKYDKPLHIVRYDDPWI